MFYHVLRLASWLRSEMVLRIDPSRMLSARHQTRREFLGRSESDDPTPRARPALAARAPRARARSLAAHDRPRIRLFRVADESAGVRDHTDGARNSRSDRLERRDRRDRR